MPGCGVRADNAGQILQQTGASEIHFSGNRLVDTPVPFWRPTVPMSAERTPGDLRRRLASAQQVREICHAARGSGILSTSPDRGE
jgi:copper homeostasis protein CutC